MKFKLNPKLMICIVFFVLDFIKILCFPQEYEVTLTNILTSVASAGLTMSYSRYQIAVILASSEASSEANVFTGLHLLGHYTLIFSVVLTAHTSLYLFLV